MVFHIGINPPDGTVNTLATDLMGNIVWYYDPVANNFPSYAPSFVPGARCSCWAASRTMSEARTRCERSIWPATPCARRTSTPSTPARRAGTGSDHGLQPRRPAPAQRRHGGPVHDPEDHRRRMAHPPSTMATWSSSWTRTSRWRGSGTRSTGWTPAVSPRWAKGPSDWTHANAIAWSPADGNLLVSMRAQDWVIKIDYANGTGDGHVIWRLGEGGDFTINSSDPSRGSPTSTTCAMSTTRRSCSSITATLRRIKTRKRHSRGQELVLNEKTMQATLVVNADLGNYASAMGSAQRLPNGNFGLRLRVCPADHRGVSGRHARTMCSR